MNGGNIMERKNKGSKSNINEWSKNNIVFLISILITIFIVIYGIIDSEGFENISSSIYLFLQINSINNF